MELLDNEAYTRTLVEVAEAAVEVSKLIAPVRKGSYRRGIKVVIRGKKVYVSATDWKSHWIEWGSINNDISAPLRLGADFLGLKMVERER